MRLPSHLCTRDAGLAPPSACPSQAVISHTASRSFTVDAAHWLLRDVTFLAGRLYPHADPSPFAARVRLADLLLATLRPHLRVPSLAPLLFAALHAVLYTAAPAAPPAPSLSLIAAATAAVWEAGAADCGPAPLLELGAPLPARVSRVRATELPAAVTVGGVVVHVPAAVGPVLAAHATVLDMFVGVAPAGAGLLVDVATVAFAAAGGGTEIGVSELPEPVAIMWPVNGSALLRPVRDWYRCVYEVCACGRGVGEGNQSDRIAPFFRCSKPIQLLVAVRCWCRDSGDYPPAPMDSECASGCTRSTARATAPSPGQPTPGVVKQDNSSGGSVDTTKTRSDPQRVRMSSGERPMGAAKGKQSDTEALCQPPPPPSRSTNAVPNEHFRSDRVFLRPN